MIAIEACTSGHESSSNRMFINPESIEVIRCTQFDPGKIHPEIFPGFISKAPVINPYGLSFSMRSGKFLRLFFPTEEEREEVLQKLLASKEPA